MPRSILMSICIGALALTGACSRHDNSTTTQPDDNQRNIVDLATHPDASISAVTVDGCLSASGDRFMLASLDRDSSKTTVYQLVNADDELRNMVGKEVRVSGQAEVTQATAETRVVTPPVAAPTSGQRDGSATATAGHHDDTPDAKVSTMTDTKLDVQKLTVASATPTGDSCAR